MKKFTIPLIDTLLLLGVIVFFGLGAGFFTPKTDGFDLVHLDENGGVYLNGEKIDQFQSDQVDYMLTVEIAERLHHRFRRDSVGDHVRLSVDGNTLTGWNNRLVDVIYGIVEFKLSSWREFTYQLIGEDAWWVEVGLHNQSTRFVIDILDDESYRLEIDEIQPDEKGLYLIVLGGDQMKLVTARGYSRRVFGEEVQIGFEQRLELAPPQQVKTDDSLMNKLKYVVELNQDGTVEINGKKHGKAKTVKQYRKDLSHRSWFDDSYSDDREWFYLIKVAEDSPVQEFEGLMYLCASSSHMFEPFSSPVYLQVGDATPCQVYNPELRRLDFRLKLLPDGSNELVIHHGSRKWPSANVAGVWLQPIYEFEAPISVAEAQSRVQSILGPGGRVFSFTGPQVFAKRHNSR